MRMTKKNISIAKLMNLKNALADCGVETNFIEEDGVISLNGTLWNCVNGNDEDFSFYIEWDNSIMNSVCPTTDNDNLVKELDDWLNNLKEN